MKILQHHPETDQAFVGEHIDDAYRLAATQLPAGTRIEVALGTSEVLPSMDFETYSEAGYVYDENTGRVKGLGAQGKGGLPVVGTPVYAAHPSTEVLCLYYDLKDGKGRRAWYPATPSPLDLIAHIQGGGLIEAWNVTFEFWIWNMVCTRRYGWPALPLSQCRCAMAKSRRHSLPGALGAAAKVLGTLEKDKEGSRLIQKLTRPLTPTKNRKEIRWTPATAWDDFLALYRYCDVDVQTEDHASAQIPDLSAHELAVWQMDQTINVRGVPVDTAALDAMLDVLGQTERKYTLELSQVTQGAVGSVSEVGKFGAWLAEIGCPLPNLQKDTVSDALKSGTTHQGVPLTGAALRALGIRDVLGAANVKKLRTLKLQTSSDGRLRDQYMYCGADRTGRWSAGGVQLQNITSKGPKSAECEGCGEFFNHDRPNMDACPHCGAWTWRVMSDWTVEAVQSAIRCLLSRDLARVERVWGDPIALMCGCLRGLFMAAEGKDFICCDFSAIEAVVAACLARCQWRIEVFSGHGKIYEMSASKITGTPVSVYDEYRAANKTHHPDRKTIGKVAELACFGPRTQLLTRRGYVSITEVKNSDELWDGVEWVEHGGAVSKGRRQVLGLDGVKVTPDHPVSLGGSWKGAKLLASNRSTLNRALVIGSANLPSCAMRKSRKSGVRSYGAAVALSRIFARLATCTVAKPLAAVSVGAQKLQRRTSKRMSNTLTSALTGNTGGGWLTDFALLSHAATARTISNTRTTAAGALRFVTNGGGRRGLELSCSTSSPCRGGLDRNWKWIAQTWTATMSRAISGLSLSGKTASTSGLSGRCKPGSTNLSDVYDIVNAGPRNRFTIKTDSGHLIVHNSGYGGWVNAWKNFGADENMSDEEIKQNVLKWRDESPEIVEMWGGQFRWCGPGKWDYRPELFGLEGAVINAILHPGQCFSHIDITYAVRDDILFCRLPSGRFLHYHRPRLSEAQDKLNRGPSYQITFEGHNSNSAKGPVGWHRMETYGGRLFENCIAEGTLVLTDRGWVEIQSVLTSDLVHDGVAWTQHGGTLFKSEQACVIVDGVLMTGDHEVLTNEGWEAASQHPRPYRPDLRDVGSCKAWPEQRQKTQVGVRLRLRARVREGFGRCLQRFKERADAKLRVLYQIFSNFERIDARHEQAPRLCGLPVDAGQVFTAYAPGMGELRRQRFAGLRQVAGRLSELLGGHGAGLQGKRPAGQEEQQPRVLPRKLPMGLREGEREQQTVERDGRYTGRAGDYLASVRHFGRKSYNALLPPRARMACRGPVPHAEFCATKKVYDIVNAGPRQRFVVLGSGGPFIVHNCVQAVALDIQAEALLRCEANGYPIVMHTHDEGVAEVPEGFGSVDEMAAIMSERPDWAAWWPLRAAGWRHKRYQKD